MLTLICGLPNAGKTTYSQQFEKVIHADDVKRHRTLCEMISKMDDVTVEGLYIVSHMRKELLKAYKGEKKVCIFLNTPLEECLRREDRHRSLMLIKNCAMVLEPPTVSEGWDEVIIIGGEDGECNS